MKRRDHGWISFDEVQNLADDIDIKVNRSFLYLAIAKYNILTKKEIFEIVLPYVVLPQDTTNKEPPYKRHLKDCTRYIQMPSQDAKTIFGSIPQKAFWKTTFMTMPRLHCKTFYKINE